MNQYINPSKTIFFNYRNIVGVCFFLIIFCFGFFMYGNVSLYFDLSAFLIVVGGTFAATFVSFKVERLKIVCQVLKNSYRTREIEPDEIVEILVDLSLKSKLHGLLSLQKDEQEASIIFLRHALGYVVDGYNTQQIRDFLTTEINYFRMRREETEQVLRTMAEVCPSFGLIGSVMGLMSMLAGIGDTSVILKTIPIALISTLYGVLFANLIFLPFAARIQERSENEILLQRIILEGIVAIGSNLHPRVLEYKLKSFLTPSARVEKLVSLDRIRKKFNLEPQTPIKAGEKVA